MAFALRGVLALLVLSLCAVTHPAQAQDAQNHPLGGFVDEVKLGLLAHDISLFAANPKEDGVDVNAEVLFVKLPFADAGRPGWLNFLLTPRPTIGGTINTNGGTSFGYLDLAWTVDYADQIFSSNDGLFGSFEFGGAIHDGPLDSDDPNRESMGSRADFHLAAELGYRFDQHFNAAIYYEHISNAGLASPNPGINNAGVRLGYRF
jgi:lipid A 3-O-deacylase